MALVAGARLGPYEILSSVGSGGMGEVYKARDTRLDRVVAIKILLVDLGDHSARQRFQREARTASSLNHPHILAVYDVGEVGGRQYLVTELVDGGTLKTWAAETPRTWREIAELLHGVADGLASAHEAGILHRDIKPDNILVGKNGYAKLADFGLAKLAEGAEATRTETREQTRHGVIVGTIAYMSPEQASGRTVDGRSDIFSLGVVLYELLAGRRPFGGATDLEVLQTVINGPLPPLGEHIPQPVRMIAEKALEKDPSDRYQSARDLAVDLRRLTRQTGSFESPAPRDRSRSGVGIAAVVLLALSVAGAVLWRARSSGPAPGPAVAASAIRSLGVLPLQNLSGDPNEEYFSDGMTEEIINQLAQLRAVRVISRTSVMGYKNTTKAMSDIGRELGVDAIITGSVRRAGGRVRVTAQLISAAADAHLWASTFDQELSDVLKLEADVASAIAREIQLQLTPEETARLASVSSINPMAQDETLLGHHYRWMGGVANMKEAVAHYERAIQLQGDFAPAYAGLSLALQTGAAAGTPTAASARAAALKAVELDPELSESHVALAGLYVGELNWSAAETRFRRALELNPNSLDACGCYAQLLVTLGRSSEALALADRMVATNPLAANGHFQRGLALYYGRRLDDAIPSLRRALELEPDQPIATSVLTRAYALGGRLQDALDLLEDPRFANSWPLAYTYAVAGRRAEALKIIETLSKAPIPDRRGIGLAYVALGDDDRGMEWLARSVEAREGTAPAIGREPTLARLRSNPRFQALVASLNLPPVPGELQR
jgi:serine/threonine protein kinase/cytochrome c-type biogenesis protein CcmH/NrfG